MSTSGTTTLAYLANRQSFRKIFVTLRPGEGSADVDLQRGRADSFVGVVEEVTQHVEQRSFVGDHLLELALVKKQDLCLLVEKHLADTTVTL